MDVGGLLEQFLGTARELAADGRSLAERKLGVPEEGSERDAMLSGMGKGALAAGALALLLGTSGGRRLTGTALKLGTVAAIGGLAYQAYQRWAAGDGGNVTVEPAEQQLPPQRARDRARALLAAMIAAAKADGHIDAAEQERIDTKVELLGLDSDALGFVRAELARPLDARAVAALADTPAAAAEMYLVSRIVIDEHNDAERDYLQTLAAELNLSPTLVAELDAQLEN